MLIKIHFIDDKSKYPSLKRQWKLIGTSGSTSKDLCTSVGYSVSHLFTPSISQSPRGQSVTHLIGQKLSNKQVAFYPRSYKIQYQTLYLDMSSYLKKERNPYSACSKVSKRSQSYWRYSNGDAM